LLTCSQVLPVKLVTFFDCAEAGILNHLVINNRSQPSIISHSTVT
jgi:hypothetical protein